MITEEPRFCGICIDAVDISTKQGLRELALLSIMYDSATRVQEIAVLCINDFRIENRQRFALLEKDKKHELYH